MVIWQITKLNYVTNYVESNHKKTDKGFKCNKCDESFTLETSLSDHQESMHVEIICEKCAFKCNSELQKHDDKHHQQAKTVQHKTCNKCSFSTPSAHYLEMHVKSHQDAISYPCENCDFETTTISLLETHMKSYEAVRQPVPNDDLLTENVSLKRQFQA